MNEPVGTPVMGRFDLADDDLVVWRYQREVDSAWLYNEDRSTLNEWNDGSEPEQVIVKRQWYEQLTEDPGP